MKRGPVPPCVIIAGRECWVREAEGEKGPQTAEVAKHQPLVVKMETPRPERGQGCPTRWQECWAASATSGLRSQLGAAKGSEGKTCPGPQGQRLEDEKQHRSSTCQPSSRSFIQNRVTRSCWFLLSLRGGHSARVPRDPALPAVSASPLPSHMAAPRTM